MNFINYEQDGMVGIITINRPEALNALNSAVLDVLNDCLDSLDKNVVRAEVLKGA